MATNEYNIFNLKKEGAILIIEKRLEKYYMAKENGETYLQSMIKNYIKNFGGVYQKDYDDFYSIANETIAKAIGGFSGSSEKEFDTYIKSCLIKRFKTEMTARNRQKRSNTQTDKDGNKIFFQDVSLDAPIDEEGTVMLGETISAKDDIEDLFNNEIDGELERFLNSLSVTQRGICKKIMSGLSAKEIKSEMGLGNNQFADELKVIKSFEKTSQLQINNKKEKNKGENEMMITEQSCEKSKRKSYAVENIIRKMANYTIRFDYSGQRESEQWPLIMKSNLISDILQDNPIPDLVLAEEVTNGFPIVWNLDGKQRCTTLETFKRDVFKISPKVKRYMIKYGTMKKDDKNNYILDEDGNPQFEWKEFDIRNKRYSQLPSELKDRFNEYTFDAVQYINCTKEEIDYHISRYNEGKPMTSSQKGIVSLGYDFATLVKSVSSSGFFKECCRFGRNDRKNGIAEKVVAETIMAAYFSNDWKKDQSKMFEYIRENANSEMFTELDEYLSDLEPEMTDELTEMFTTPDAFLWLGVYVKMRKKGFSAKEFVRFLTEFKNDLCDTKVNNKSFNDIVAETKVATGDKGKRGTKDAAVVIEKINILVYLMGNCFKPVSDLKNADISLDYAS